MIIEPLNDRVLVLRLAPTETTTGGLFIPEQAKDKPMIGKVIATGPGQHKDTGVVPTGVAPGDCVLFAKYAGVEVQLGGEPHLVLRADEILGVVRNQ